MTYLLVLVLMGQPMVPQSSHTSEAACSQQARYKSAQTGNNYGCIPIQLEGPRAPLR